MQRSARGSSSPSETVESHVRNTLNKLGFKSRAQIASWIATSNR